jgi:hypothetical protein
VAKGDSGSVCILQSNDMAIGLNFAGSPAAVMPGPPYLTAYPEYYSGFSYDLQSQMDAPVSLLVVRRYGRRVLGEKGASGYRGLRVTGV